MDSTKAPSFMRTSGRSSLERVDTTRLIAEQLCAMTLFQCTCPALELDSIADPPIEFDLTSAAGDQLSDCPSLSASTSQISSASSETSTCGEGHSADSLLTAQPELIASARTPLQLLLRSSRQARIYRLLDRLRKSTICTDQHGCPQPETPGDCGPQPNLSTIEPAANMAENASSTAMTGRLWSASAIAEPFSQSLREDIESRVQSSKARPRLVGILATRSAPSIAYSEWTQKACASVGIDFRVWKTWSEDKSSGEEAPTAIEVQEYNLEADVEDLIIAANADPDIHGIMVYYPIFGGRRDTYLQQIVDPRKDVEGLHFSYCWNMYHNVRWISPSQVGTAPGTYTELGTQQPQGPSELDGVPKGFAKSILPCTPLAVVKCLEAMGVYDSKHPYGDRLFGKTITVVNRSEVVGRPLAALLANDGAQVFSIDIDSIQEFNKRPQSDVPDHSSDAVKAARDHNAARRLRPHHVVRPCSMSAQACIERSDVVIGGVPSPSYKIPTAWIKSGATCINFSSEKNFERDVRTRAAHYLPIIGKTTIAMLQRNLIRLLDYKEAISPSH